MKQQPRSQGCDLPRSRAMSGWGDQHAYHLDQKTSQLHACIQRQRFPLKGFELGWSLVATSLEGFSAAVNEKTRERAMPKVGGPSRSTPPCALGPLPHTSLGRPGWRRWPWLEGRVLQSQWGGSLQRAVGAKPTSGGSRKIITYVNSKTINS